MRKNLAVDVPVDAETEVDRIRGLKKSIFTRTRIATLCLVMVVALSVTGTMAFEKWSGNATPNRGWMSYVGIKIGENGDNYDEEQNHSFGKDNKKVHIEIVTTDTTDPDLSYDVSVSFVPEVASNSYADTLDASLDGGYIAMAERWIEGIQTDSTGRDYIETAVMKLYLADGWEDEWTYEAGIFKSKSAVKPNETAGGWISDNLLSGVVLNDEILQTDYKNYRVRVVAQTIKHIVTDEEKRDDADA